MEFIGKTKDELKKNIEEKLDGVEIQFCKYEKIPIVDNSPFLWLSSIPRRAYENKVVAVASSEEAEGFIIGGIKSEFNIFEGLRKNKKGKLETCYTTYIFPEGEI